MHFGFKGPTTGIAVVGLASREVRHGIETEAPPLPRPSGQRSTTGGGRLMNVQVNVADTYGPTVSEAVRALEACFDMWRQEQLPKRQ